MRRRLDNQVKRTEEKVRTIVGVEDMVLLGDVRDSGIVENLKLRLKSENIYTNIGHVLIAVNPYKWLDIYGPSVMKQYVHQNRVDVPCHIFATAEAAYRGMVLEEDNQCIIISGESGAGKTEASKQIQSYIAAVSGGGDGVDKIKKVFLESNPVLEAFGNAKTLRNNNSSRFGKYFELKFNKFGSPCGGVITNYLLEKSRIVRPGKGERNFHIFYQLVASKNHAASLGLAAEPSNFDLLSCGGCTTVDAVNDSSEFDTTIAAMKSVGMKNQMIQSIISLVAAIIHLGNVKFQSCQVDGVEGSRISKGNSIESLRKFCELLSLDVEAVTHTMTFRELQTMAAGGKVDVYQVPQNPTQAGARRDVIAKSLYERLFDMIVSRINIALDPGVAAAAAASDGDELLSIGVLDIYGFEVFDNNSFEQLCINYVNERLQQIFIELTLRAEQEEYEREGITWEPIPFFNNKVVCELLDGARPPGIFRILDDSCKTMHGTKEASEVDRKFLETCTQVHSSHAHYSAVTNCFAVQHYAGPVTYTCGKFGESNKDALNQDILALLKSSTDKLITFLYPEEVNLDNKKAPPTASYTIRTQCQALVTALMDCSPHYIRCIKSNDQKAALTIDQTRVLHQVKYLGLNENIKVRRAGFAYRADYHRFLERFALLSKDTYPEWRGADRDGCRNILKTIASKIPGLTTQEAQLGKSKVFIRHPETYFAIEKLREQRLGDFVAVIQRAWRRYRDRREYIILQRKMATLYASNRKYRRRDSIFRPYCGDYLGSLDAKVVDGIRDGIFRIVDNYDKEEQILFADTLCSQIVNTSSSSLPCPYHAIEKRILILTSAAIYLMEIFDPNNHSNNQFRNVEKSILEGKLMPAALLRRRVPLRALEGVHLSLFADNCITLLVPPAAQKEGGGDKSHWVADKDAEKCTATGTAFSIFTWRHHCRICGDAFVDTACDYYQTIPDLGWYTPSRICNYCIGKTSTDALEDIFLVTPRKTELVSLLQTQWQKIQSHGKELPVKFGNNLRLRPSPIASLSLIPSNEISFTETTTSSSSSSSSSSAATGRKKKVSSQTIDEADYFKAEKSGSNAQLRVIAPRGLAHDVVEEKRKRQEKLAKRAEKRRRQEEMERRERWAAKEEVRERERLQRLEEKKARRAAEKQARRAQAEKSSATTASKTTTGGRTFGAAQPPQPPPPPPSSSSSSNGATGARNWKTNGNTGAGNGNGSGAGNVAAVKPPAGGRFAGVPSAASGANSELAAKMAARLAKNGEA